MIETAWMTWICLELMELMLIQFVFAIQTSNDQLPHGLPRLRSCSRNPSGNVIHQLSICG